MTTASERDPQVDEGPDRSDNGSAPIGALQAAALEVIDATRAFLDIAEAMVNDPDTVDRISSVISAARNAATRPARAEGVRHIKVL